MKTPHETATKGALFPGCPRHYADQPRHMWNNGFRRHWLSVGERHAAAINAARCGDMSTVRRFGSTLGGLSQVAGWANDLFRRARKMNSNVPPYRIVDRVVFIPNLTWRYSGSRQVAVIQWLPMFGPGLHNERMSR